MAFEYSNRSALIGNFDTAGSSKTRVQNASGPCGAWPNGAAPTGLMRWWQKRDQSGLDIRRVR